MKAGILLLLTILLGLTGAVNKASAFITMNIYGPEPVDSSSAKMEDIGKIEKTEKGRNSCSTPVTYCSGKIACSNPEPKKQIQSAVVIANTKENNFLLNGAVTSAETQVNADIIFNLINKYRETRGLPPFEREDKLCSLALARSSELTNELSNGTLHSGLYNRNMPYWVWENAKVGSNEEGTVQWWINSPIHHASIIGDYKYSCGACSGNRCSQLFTSYAPK